MLGGREAYERLPYFFTDQYDLGMEYVGHVGPRGSTSWWCVETLMRCLHRLLGRDGRVAAAMHANDWEVADTLRSIVEADIDLTRLRDVGIPLAEVLAT